jgi:hypothetical protein
MGQVMTVIVAGFAKFPKVRKLSNTADEFEIGFEKIRLHSLNERVKQTRLGIECADQDDARERVGCQVMAGAIAGRESVHVVQKRRARGTGDG